MTGLEKIVSSICEDALAEAKTIIDEAKSDAAQALADAKADTEAYCAQIEAAAKRKAADIARSGESAVELQRRRGLLKTKQEILAQTMERALDALYALPDEAYFDLLLKMAAASAEQGTGELLLSDRDLKRCPQDFSERLARVLPKGASLTVSRETRPIDGGFILKYGDVEQNCSFRAMFDARWDEMTDKARGILFA